MQKESEMMIKDLEDQVRLTQQEEGEKAGLLPRVHKPSSEELPGMDSPLTGEAEEE